MHALAEKLTTYLIANEVASESMKDEYVYGLEVFGLKCINYGTILGLSLLFDTLVPTFFFMVCFFPLRGRTGGFHSKSATTCYFGTIAIYILISRVIAPVFTRSAVIMVSAFLVSTIVIIILAPLNHENLKLSEKEMMDCKKSTSVILLLIISFVGASSYAQINDMCLDNAISGVVLDAVLVLSQKIIEGKKIYSK